MEDVTTRGKVVSISFITWGMGLSGFFESDKLHFSFIILKKEKREAGEGMTGYRCYNINVYKN